MNDHSHPAPRAPLLFIHGTHAGAWMFERWLPWFEALGHRCVAIDLPGHASAPLPAGATLGKIRFAAYVDHAEAAAEALGRPIVIGHSLGGLVAQALAERDAVGAAALVSPAPPRGIPVIGARMLAYQIRDLPTVLLGRTVHPSWPTMRDLVLNRVPAAERRALFERLGPESGTVSRQLALTGVRIDARRVRCPVFVVAGGEDLYIPPGRARRVARRYHAPLRVLPRRGHVMMQEPGWEEAAGVIGEWVAQVTGDR